MVREFRYLKPRGCRCCHCGGRLSVEGGNRCGIIGGCYVDMLIKWSYQDLHFMDVKESWEIINNCLYIFLGLDMRILESTMFVWNLSSHPAILSIQHNEALSMSKVVAKLISLAKVVVLTFYIFWFWIRLHLNKYPPNKVQWTIISYDNNNPQL